MALILTDQQIAINDHASTGEDLIAEAGAGTGKTSTLRVLGKNLGTKGLYIAYNHTTARSARQTFPKNVRATTASSLAVNFVRAHRAHRIPREIPSNLVSKEVMTLLRDRGEARDSLPVAAMNQRPLTPYQVSGAVGRTVARFCLSASPEVTASHMPRIAGCDRDSDEYAEAAEEVARLSSMVWEDIMDPRGNLPYTFEICQKMWQLARPIFDEYDFLMFDEAQDTDEVTADVIERQSCQRLITGDRYQELYGWRNAINAMSRWDWKRLWLTKSFRFGPAIAKQANLWLDYLNAEIRLTGYDQVESKLGRLDEPTAILCRSNAGVVEAALLELQAGRSVYVVKGIGEMATLASAAQSWANGRTPANPDFAAFANWDAFRDWVSVDPDGDKYTTHVRIIESYGPDRVLELQSLLTPNEKNADVTVSTAHKAKGLEWPTVRVHTDFAKPNAEDGSDPRYSREDAMLNYVTVTRAQHVLDPGPLRGGPLGCQL